MDVDTGRIGRRTGARSGKDQRAGSRWLHCSGQQADELHLHPEIASKAERGYALSDAALAGPVKAFASTVTQDMRPIDAFRSIALSCLLQLQRNEAGAVVGENPEYVHQARVAIRRLRSAFKLFSPVLEAGFVKVYGPRWGKLAGGLGSARDWDVFLTETLAMPIWRC